MRRGRAENDPITAFGPDEFEKMAINAKETMGGLFLADPCPLSVADCVKIYETSYR